MWNPGGNAKESRLPAVVLAAFGRLSLGERLRCDKVGRDALSASTEWLATDAYTIMSSHAASELHTSASTSDLNKRFERQSEGRTEKSGTAGLIARKTAKGRKFLIKKTFSVNGAPRVVKQVFV